MPSEIASGAVGSKYVASSPASSRSAGDVRARHAARPSRAPRHGQAEALPQARQHEHLGVRVEVAQFGVVDAAERDDALGRADAHVAPAVGADEREPNAPAGAADEAERLEQRGQVLARLGRADARAGRAARAAPARAATRTRARSRSGSRARCDRARRAGRPTSRAVARETQITRSALRTARGISVRP